MQSAEVGIVGAGPIAIECAIALKKADISYLQFDKEQAGQMIFNFPLQTHFFSSSERIALAGIPLQTIDQQKCSREAYLTYLRMVISNYHLKIHAYEKIIDIRKDNEGFVLTGQSISGQNEYWVRFLVLATGGTSWPRLLDVPGENLPHVSTKLGDIHQYFQQRVVIVGSKNSAAEAALRCYHAGAHVSMVYRRELFDPIHIKYWILPELQGLIDNQEIVAYPSSKVTEIFSDHIEINMKGEKRCIKSDFVIKGIGFEADMSLFRKLGVKLHCPQQSPVFDSKTMETDIKNVFVLGTVIGGTQERYRIFIENCHDHAFKILKEISGRIGKQLPEDSIHYGAVVSQNPEE